MQVYSNTGGIGRRNMYCQLAWCAMFQVGKYAEEGLYARYASRRKTSSRYSRSVFGRAAEPGDDVVTHVKKAHRRVLQGFLGKYFRSLVKNACVM